MITKSSLKCEQFDQSMPDAIYEKMKALANQCSFTVSEETQNFIDHMMSRKLVFIDKISPSQRRSEKHYEQFRTKRMKRI